MAASVGAVCGYLFPVLVYFWFIFNHWDFGSGFWGSKNHSGTALTSNLTGQYSSQACCSPLFTAVPLLSLVLSLSWVSWPRQQQDGLAESR